MGSSLDRVSFKLVTPFYQNDVLTCSTRRMLLTCLFLFNFIHGQVISKVKDHLLLQSDILKSHKWNFQTTSSTINFIPTNIYCYNKWNIFVEQDFFTCFSSRKLSPNQMGTAFQIILLLFLQFLFCFVWMFIIIYISTYIYIYIYIYIYYYVFVNQIARYN